MQYTRNMVTGASTADLAIILIDARTGRHRADPPPRDHRVAAAASRTSSSASTRWTSSTSTRGVSTRSRTTSQPFAPRSEGSTSPSSRCRALLGDNVVDASRHMPWYQGPTLLDYLETSTSIATATSIAVRFPVQYVDPAADVAPPLLPGLRGAGRGQRHAARRRRRRPAGRAPPRSRRSTPSTARHRRRSRRYRSRCGSPTTSTSRRGEA